MPKVRGARNGADRERRLERLAIAALSALGAREGAVQDAERRVGEALRTTTDDEGLSVREAVEWCGNRLTLREITRLRRLDGGQQDGAREPRVGCAAGLAAPAETLPM